jgi:hypothetical protein
MYINAVADSVMLCLQHGFYNIIFKMKHKLYAASGSTPPPPPVKNFGCPPAICRRKFHAHSVSKAASASIVRWNGGRITCILMNSVDGDIWTHILFPRVSTCKFRVIFWKLPEISEGHIQSIFRVKNVFYCRGLGLTMQKMVVHKITRQTTHLRDFGRILW